MGGGGKGGGGGNAAANVQAQLAQQLFQESTPLRQLLLGAPGGTGGKLGELITNPPNVPFERDVLESQFGRARESLLAGAPARGGALNASLTDLAAQRALGVTGLAQAQQQQQINNLFQTAGLATGQTQVSLGGLGQAGSTLAAAGAARQASQLQALGGLGLGMGTAVGAGKAPGSVKAA